jgi:hypothetical protein
VRRYDVPVQKVSAAEPWRARAIFYTRCVSDMQSGLTGKLTGITVTKIVASSDTVKDKKLKVIITIHSRSVGVPGV